MGSAPGWRPSVGRPRYPPQSIPAVSGKPPLHENAKLKTPLPSRREWGCHSERSDQGARLFVQSQTRLAACQRLLLFRRPSSACPPVREPHWRQPHHCHGVIVCSNPVLPFDAAAIASVHQHLLSVCPERHADGGHQRAAWALPVAWPSPVDVPGGQAKGTVVPMLATGDRLSYENAALPAAKGLILVPAHSWPESLHCSACLSSASTWPGIDRYGKRFVVFQACKFGSCETWQLGVLRLGNRPGRSRTIGTQALSTQNILSCGKHGLRAARDHLALHKHRPGRKWLGRKTQQRRPEAIRDCTLPTLLTSAAECARTLQEFEISGLARVTEARNHHISG